MSNSELCMIGLRACWERAAAIPGFTPATSASALADAREGVSFSGSDAATTARQAEMAAAQAGCCW